MRLPVDSILRSAACGNDVCSMSHSPTTAVNSSARVGDAPPSLLERHRGWLTRVISARAGSVDAVDEVLQEVAVAVARSGHPPAGETEERPWLCAIAIRQCALRLRKAVRRAQLLVLAAERLPRDAASRLQDDPIYWLVRRESSALVAKALEALDRDQRSLIEAKYVEGMTYQAIATRLGVPRHVAEYRVTVAKRLLRGLLVDSGLDEEDAP